MKSKHQSGVTLIEMMVGIVVGLIVLWGLSSVYVNAARGSRTNSAANALNQDLRAVMDIMVGDIRRAGYWSTTVEGVNPFTTTAAPIRNLNVAADCIIYSYDATHVVGSVAGVPDTGVDFFGFRRNGAVVQTLDPTGLSVTSGGCANNAQWQNLTDERAITVTTLTFDTIGSQCMAYQKSTYDPSNTATFASWRTTAGTGVACAPGASGAPGTYPVAANTFVETRQINIRLSATSIADPTLSARTLIETVYVRNNRVILPP